MNVVAILPSRNEPATITAVTTAVDAALASHSDRSVIIHADSSDLPGTAERFAGTDTQAVKVSLTDLVRGKGAQILAATRRPEAMAADAVLIADTDTRNPDPVSYATLLDRVRAGAACSIADYPRYWDEANLTNHLARPLIAATNGHDVPQPLAGDLALSGTAMAAVRRAAATRPMELTACVDGYGIDVFLLLTAATVGPVVSVRLDAAKRHAGSFPHLPAIYHQVVPVLLYLTAGRTLAASVADRSVVTYRVTGRDVGPDRLQSMLATLEDLASFTDGYDEQPWPLPAAHAWHAVRSGRPTPDVAQWLWPHYLRQVRDWLTRARHATTGQRVEQLAAAHARLHTALTSTGAR